MPVRKAFVLLAMLLAAPAFGWGDKGHQIAALVAYRHLTPTARAALDSLLASDRDPLTAPDFGSRATWADRYRTAHHETAAWHFINVEIDDPDLDTACGAEGCITQKTEEFFAQLKNPATPLPQRLLALKFLIHFVADLHQPLHAADHHDRGGNCVLLSPAPEPDAANLHAFWDLSAVDALGNSAVQITERLDAAISPEAVTRWRQGSVRSWIWESFQLAQRDAYAVSAKPTCDTRASIELSSEYRSRAVKDTAEQLQKSGIRMAELLNQALGGA